MTSPVWLLLVLVMQCCHQGAAHALTMVFGPPETIGDPHFGPPHPSRPFGGKMSNTLDLYPDGMASGHTNSPVSSTDGGKTWQNVSENQQRWLNYTGATCAFFSSLAYFSNSTHKWAQDFGNGLFHTTTPDEKSFSTNETSIFRFDKGMLTVEQGPIVTFTGLPRPVCAAKNENWLSPHASGHVVLADGTHVQSAILEWCGAPFPNDRTSLVVFHSRNGYDYEYIANISTALDMPFSREGPNEHDLALLPNGDILCVMRVGAGDPGGGGVYLPFYKSLSKDGGKTWSKAEVMPGMGCARPHLLQIGNVTLLSGGRRMISHAYDRSFDIYMSQDGAVTWEQASGSYHHNAKAKFSKTPHVPLWPASVNKTGWRFEFTSGYVGLVRVGEASAMVLYDYAIPYVGEDFEAPIESARDLPTRRRGFRGDLYDDIIAVSKNIPFSYAMQIDLVPKVETSAVLI